MLQFEQAILSMEKAAAFDDMPRKHEDSGEVYALGGHRTEALETIELLKKRRQEKNETAVGPAG